MIQRVRSWWTAKTPSMKIRILLYVFVGYIVLCSALAALEIFYPALRIPTDILFNLTNLLLGTYCLRSGLRQSSKDVRQVSYLAAGANYACLLLRLFGYWG